MKLTVKHFVNLLAGIMFSLCSVIVFADMIDTTTQSAPKDFTHIQTGFPLTGAHSMVECGVCHAGGVFKGLPRNCSGCHSQNGRIVATTMPRNHVASSDPCETCHTNTVTFSGARFNHGKVAAGNCTSCHNGIISVGKPRSHNSGLQIVESCERCHRTYSWTSSGFNHTAIAPKSCATQCHNGVLAAGRPADHTTPLKLTSPCDTCHRYSAWSFTFYDHAAVLPGRCTTCHNGGEAKNRPSSHTGLKASLSCDRCHHTHGWSPAPYDHIGVVVGFCASCHNGSLATAKPASHKGAKATMTCDQCHNTSAWSPAFYNHVGVVHGTCSTCHLANRPSSHGARGYTSSCDNCHSIGSSWIFNHAAQQGLHTCNSCHAFHNNQTPCDYCHSVYSWGGD